MPFSERPFALGLFFRKTNEAAIVVCLFVQDNVSL